MFDYILVSSLLTLLSRKEDRSDGFLVTCEMRHVYIYSQSVQAFEPCLDIGHQCGALYFDVHPPRCCDMIDQYNPANGIAVHSVDNFEHVYMRHARLG